MAVIFSCSVALGSFSTFLIGATSFCKTFTRKTLKQKMKITNLKKMKKKNCVRKIYVNGN